jgi:membrane glycosyltransferase
MIVLDADSLIDAPTLLRLVQVMQADPTLGILADRSAAHRSANIFRSPAAIRRLRVRPGHHARLWPPGPGDSGNYWGHNAIIRMRAFAENCGLPTLKGRKPFGGHVLSHDFVEAALMRRGGWKVRMATDCGGSWEESPPSLIDVAIRDRRWAQGNLQHMKIIGAAGLTFTSRLHLGIGIMSYLSSPLWLLMLGIGFALAVQSHLIRPEYFSHDFQLFPDVAAIRCRTDDGAVLVQHGRAADTENARPDSRAAVGADSSRRRRRHRRRCKLSAGNHVVGPVRAGTDADAEPARL